MSVLSLFPKAAGRIRTFLAYYDSGHSFKRGQGSGPLVCVWICLGCFLLICAGCWAMPLTQFSLLIVFIVLRCLNPSGCSEKCYRTDAESWPVSGLFPWKLFFDAQFKFLGEDSLRERQFFSHSKSNPQSSLKATDQILHWSV